MPTGRPLSSVVIGGTLALIALYVSISLEAVRALIWMAAGREPSGTGTTQSMSHPVCLHAAPPAPQDTAATRVARSVEGALKLRNMSNRWLTQPNTATIGVHPRVRPRGAPQAWRRT